MLFCFLIVFASFFLLNLTLAVIWEEFDKSSKKFEKAKAKTTRRKSRGRRVSVNDMCKTSSPGLGGNSMFRLVTHGNFTATVIVLIVLNTIILALDHHQMDEQFEANLEYTNFCLTLAFTIEMVLKLLGLGLKLYVR